MNPNRGDNLLVPFGLERDPISLVARAWYTAHVTPSSWAQNEAERLFNKYAHRDAVEPGEWFRGLNTPLTFEQIVDDLEAHGWRVDPWLPSNDTEFDAWTGTNRFYRAVLQSTIQPDAFSQVELEGDRVAQFVRDLEASGLWIVNRVVAL